ncbi:MAG: arsenate reductase/protein-tyrosine-phosphatase family protein [Acidimicrobiia bacterium]
MGDPARLAIVDELAMSDRCPQELVERFGIVSNLLAHHLTVLERAGLITRWCSSGDGRRRYVHLHHDAVAELGVPRQGASRRMLFVCSRNSARSPLAAGLWEKLTQRPAKSAGSHPAEAVHPGAIAAARRNGVDLRGIRPRPFVAPSGSAVQVVTVCDQAHEELDPAANCGWWHWSIRDPVALGTARAFDDTIAELRERIGTLVAADLDDPSIIPNVHARRVPRP